MIASRNFNRRCQTRSVTTRLAVLALMALAVAAPAAAGCDDDDRPAAPHSLRANPLGSGGIMLQWSSNVGHYDIYIRDEKGRAVPEAPDIIGGADYKNYLEFYGLKPDKKYFFSIRARTEGGTQGCISKDLSETVSAKTDRADLNSRCSNYAHTAMEQMQEMRDKQCQIPGNTISGVWAKNEGTHFLYCLEQLRADKNEYAKAQWDRNQDLQACKKQAAQCNKYKRTAVYYAMQNKILGCGYGGGRWSFNGALHYSWCMGAKPSERVREGRARVHLLSLCRKKKAETAKDGGGGGGACPVPADWADMLAAHNEFRGQYCGGPLTWSCDLAKGAQAYADKCECGHSNTEGVGENLAARSIIPDKFPAGPDRDAFNDTWACEKDLYDFAKPEIVGGFKNNCLSKEQGGEGVNGHFAQVVWKSMTQLGCGRARCPVKVFKDNKCEDVKNDKGEIQYQTNWVCWYRGYDSQGKSIGGFSGPLADNVQKPPQCGKAFHSRSNITCFRGMVLTSSGVCACPPGRRWNGRMCAPHVITSAPTPPQSGTETCPRDRPVGTPPNCCPVDTHFDPSVNPPRGSCVADARKGGNQNAEAPPRERPPPGRPICPRSRPVGTPPNCCPVNTHFDGNHKPRPACVSDAANTGPGNQNTNTERPPRTTGVCEGRYPVGTYPNCCAVGKHFERTAKHPRGACVSAGTTGGPGNDGTQGTKPGGDSGSGPKCPSGTHFARTAKHPGGACVSDKREGGPGTSGPGVKCPPGTHATRSGGCEQDASPTTKPTPTPAQAKCSGGRHGVPPNCFCPRNTKFIGGRCRYMPKPKPTPTGPSPAQKCPAGMKGPKCDQVIVN
jgi:hypothetical protein